MNSIGFKDPVSVAFSTSDPFNYPMPSRDLCMSMNTITAHMTTFKPKPADLSQNAEAQ